MTEEKPTQEVNWDEAITSSGYISLDEETEKKIQIINWKMIKGEKFGQQQVEFIAEVVKEDGKPVTDKLFTTTSNRLKTKLKPLLENLDASKPITLTVLKIGTKFDTRYMVKLVDNE